MERAERLGTLLQWLSLFTFVGLALWLQTDILPLTGGALMLLLASSYLPMLGRSNPAWTMALSGTSLLAISMFGENLFTSLFINARLSEFSFVFLLIWSFMFSVVALALVVGQFLPPDSKPRDYPIWAKKLWTITTGVAGGSLILVALVSGVSWGGGEGKIENLSLIISAATLLVSVVLGMAAVSLFPSLERNLVRRPLPRQLTAAVATLLLGGIPVEFLRGNWLLWLFTVSAFVAVLVWMSRIVKTRQPQADAVP